MSDTATHKLRNPRTLFAPLCMFIILVVVSSLLLCAANGVYYYWSEGDPNWTPVSTVEQVLTLSVLGLSLISLATFLGAIIFTLTTTIRLVRNLKVIGSGHMSISPFWAAASYFVPFANLVVPVNAISEAWSGTYAELETPPREPNGAIAWWWGLWLLSNILDNVASRMLGSGFLQAPTQPPPEMLSAGVTLTVVASLSLALSAVFMLLLFGKLTSAQSQMIDAIKQKEAAVS